MFAQLQPEVAVAVHHPALIHAWLAWSPVLLRLLKVYRGPPKLQATGSRDQQISRTMPAAMLPGFGSSS